MEDEQRLLSDHHRDDAASRNNRQKKLPFFGEQIAVWFLTIIFLVLFLATLKVYERKGSFSSGETAKFNGITNALSLLLALNFLGGFRGLAKVLRWRILHEKTCTRKEADLILGVDSLSKVFRLGWESRLKPFTLLFCIAWVILNFVSFPIPVVEIPNLDIFKLLQVPVGLLSLTNSTDGGVDYNGTYIKDSIHYAPNLTCYLQPLIPDCPGSTISQSLANSYGRLAIDAPCCPYDDISDVYNSRMNCRYFCKTGDLERRDFVYRFLEYNLNDTQGTYPLFTNRTITTSSGTCFKYNITNNPVPDNRQGNTDDLVFQYTNGTVNGSISIPRAFWAVDATTYIYRGTNIPEKATIVSCGPRCLWMWAYKSQGFANSDHETALYQCPITIGSVTNVTNYTQEVPNDVARLAAAAIGLQGRSVTTNTGGQDWTQFQFYPFGANWEIHGISTANVGLNMAEFAMRSIVYMAETNRQILVGGPTPYLGTRLTVHWRFVIILCAYIAGMHLLLVVSTVYATINVVIQKDSNLSIAKVMLPLLDKSDLPKNETMSERKDHFTYGIVKETGTWGMYSKTAKDIPLEAIGR